MKTSAEKFWFGWLKIAAMLCTLFGIFMALFNQTEVLGFLNKHIVSTFYKTPELAYAAAPAQAWLIGVLGATMTGWGVAILYLIHYPLQRKEQWAWNAILLPLLIWFLIDSSLSACHGAYFNVIINFVLILQFIAPLMFLRNSFSNQKITLQ